MSRYITTGPTSAEVLEYCISNAIYVDQVRVELLIRGEECVGGRQPKWAIDLLEKLGALCDVSLSPGSPEYCGIQVVPLYGGSPFTTGGHPPRDGNVTATIKQLMLEHVVPLIPLERVINVEVVAKERVNGIPVANHDFAI